MQDENTMNTTDIMLTLTEMKETAKHLRRHGEELEEMAGSLETSECDGAPDAESLNRMADYVQQRATTAQEEAQRLQGVADRLRRRAQEAERTQRREEGSVSRFQPGDAVTIAGEAQEGVPGQAYSRVGLVDERAAVGTHLFVRFLGVPGNILVESDALVAATISEETRAAIEAQKRRESA